MKYEDIKARRHELLRQLVAINAELKALDQPLLDQLAKCDDAQKWVDPYGWAHKELKAMHRRNDPK